jgi:PD-(D/E)XK endonuclease
MASLKTKGDLAELKVASDLLQRGYRIAIPYGEDHDFDLILCRDDSLERVQVKYTESDGRVVYVRCRSSSLTKGKVRRIKHYTARTIEWIAVYDKTTDRCYYLSADELGNGRDLLTLRLVPTGNNQRQGIRYAEEYTEPLKRRLNLGGRQPAGPRQPI